MKLKALFGTLLSVCFLMLALPAFAQSTTAGDIAGVISDPSGAVLPKASVTAKSDATGATAKTTTNGEGFYRFSLLQPGVYTVTVEATGFKPSNRKVAVTVGQVVNANIQVSVNGTETILEVTAPALQVESADVTTSFSNVQISQLPNPGNDLSAIAQTAPGVVMSTGGGFGNFSSFGLPATSNLFTLNGMNDNDPFLNLNNSGPTNLLLGSNDLEEATVVNNGYSGQYGQLAGAQVNYITKSGTNQWHGNAVYYWNGRAMNANNYFNNASSPATPRPFDNVNQWAGSIGGPIRKDKTFFFFNYEGLRVVLPTSQLAIIPSQQFEAATIQNLTNNGLAASVPFYQSIFSLYNNAAGAARATPTSTACAFAGLAAGAPCTEQFRSTAGNFTHEYLMNLRIDHNFSDSDKIYGRAQVDRGVQATLTDPINPLFNTVSTQPEFQTQIGWTHVFGSSAVNELKLSDVWYSAQFDNASRAASLAAFRSTMILADASMTSLGGQDFNFPQGRNVNQYQIVDDYQRTKGNHTWKFGVNFHRDDVTDFDYGQNTSGTLVVNSLQDFFNGGSTNSLNPACQGAVLPTPPPGGPDPCAPGNSYQQAFATRLSQPIALYTLGFYGQDEWRINQKFKLSLSLRVDHNSNPVCQTNCFAALTVPFTTLAQNPNAANLPFNQVIKTGLHQAYPSTDMLVWQPRLGFTWSPLKDNKTVISGGLGIFTDSFPATVVDGFSKNSPFFNTFAAANAFGHSGLSPIAPGQTGNVFSQTANANTVFVNGFASGGTAASLGVSPNLTSSDSEIRQPRYQEWNLQIQRELGWKTVLSLNYVGNHGIHEVVANSGVNAFSPTGFGGLATVAPDAAFGAVTQYQSIATSNYNGLVTSLRHNFDHGFTFQASYTWSHALDEISNAGLLPYNLGTAASIGTLVNPFNLRANYGNADYDIRHNFTANYVWDNSLRHLFKFGPNWLFGGWNVSGTVFVHSGSPFSVIDSGITSTLAPNYVGPVLATIIGPTAGTVSCGVGSTTAPAVPTPCLNSAGFVTPGNETGFGNQARNNFRGPGYFDTDFTLMKHNKLYHMEHGELNFGVQFFNLFNHPNFDNPVNDINNAGLFGVVARTVNTPTSILGSFLGGDASPRLIQLKAEFKF